MATVQGNTPAASKPCFTCKEIKSLDAFSPNKKTRTGRQGSCRACTCAKQKVCRATDPNWKARCAAYRATHRSHQRAANQRYLAKPGKRGRDRERSKQWKAANKERNRVAFKKWQLRRLYGITPEQVEAMRVAQNNCCAICSEEFRRTPYIDHDHATGEVRGLLCNRCNLGLGRYEAAGFLESCAKYLESHRRSRIKAV